MREVKESVDLCAGGALSPAAIGWSRRPLHRCNVPRSARRKRWDYWCVTDGRIFLALVVADIEYLRGGVVSLVDLSTGKATERIAPIWSAPQLGEAVGEPVHFAARDMTIDLTPGRMRARAGELSADIEVDAPRDSLGVVVPGERRFWYTCKQIGLGARGRVSWPGGSVVLEGATAALDFGRGQWPARTRWNWAAAGGPELSFNLGGRWTDGSGATENGVFAGGVLHKIDDTVRFDGDRVHGPGVELQFTPSCRRRVGLPPLFGLHWRTGHFNGHILDWKINGLFGWNEALDLLW
jgi:hypothetical protein